MYTKEEIEAAFLAFEETHERCFHGDVDWAELSSFLTDDVDYTDPGWGRFHGAKDVAKFLQDSMAGLEAWDFPMRWYIVDDTHVVKKYSMVLTEPRKTDGSCYEISGVYMMRYAGDGKFSWVEDQCDMNHFMDVIKKAPWTPGPGFNIPSDVNWD